MRALLTGYIRFSLFAFPRACSAYRIVTTARSDNFDLGAAVGLTALRNPLSAKICLWSPHVKTAFMIPVAEEFRDAVELCSSSEDCRSPLSRMTEGSVELQTGPGSFLQFDADNPRFGERFRVLVRLEQKARFFNGTHHFGDTDKAAVIPVATRAPAVGSTRRKEASRTAHTIQITGILALAVVGVGMIVRYAAKRPTRRRGARDEAEERLLGDGDPERFAPFPRVDPGDLPPPERNDVPYPSVVFPEAGPMQTQ